MYKKQCEQCKLYFGKKIKYSLKQWAKRRFCCLKCCGKHKVSVGWVPIRNSGKYFRAQKHRNIISMGVKRMYLLRGNEVRIKISMANKGRKVSPKGIKNMCIAQRKSKAYRGGELTRKARKCFYQKQREVRKLNNGGCHTLNEWENLKSLYFFSCPSCLKTEPTIKLTEDHIIPLIRGGSNNISNIQPLCHNCNSKKHKKFIFYEIPAAAKN